METPAKSAVLDWLRSYGVCLGARAGAGAVQRGVEGGAGDAGCWWMIGGKESGSLEIQAGARRTRD